MARITYGVYLDCPDSCYTISNNDQDWTRNIAPRASVAPSIKMTILETDSDNLHSTFDAGAIEWNHPELVDNLMLVLRDELPGWVLTGIDVAVYGLDLFYQAEHESDPLRGTDQVVVSGNYKLLFEINRACGTPVERYIVEHRMIHPSELAPYNRMIPNLRDVEHICKFHVVRITEFVGFRKRRVLEMREDNHCQDCISGKQYCLVTEY